MCWPLGFGLTQGFTNWSKNWPLIAATFAVMLASFGLMSLASRDLPVGTVYAVWTGLGTTGIVLIGMTFMNEPKTIGRFVCLALIIIGVVGFAISLWLYLASRRTTPGPPPPSSTYY
jgi:quaternary ammonium compound-resistance protein SugE